MVPNETYSAIICLDSTWFSQKDGNCLYTGMATKEERWKRYAIEAEPKCLSKLLRVSCMVDILRRKRLR